MVNNQNQSPKLNNSKSKEQKIESTLSKIRNGAGGAVSYVFVSERYDKDGNVIYNKSFLHSSINPEVFFKLENNKKVKRTIQEVIEVFEAIKVDLGATEYIID